MKNQLRRLLGMFIACLGLSPAWAIEHTDDSVGLVKERVQKREAILVDVREKNETDEGRLKDAQLVPLSVLKESKQPAKLEKDKILYLHCRSGRRCLAAAEILKKQGYNVRPLKQGYDDLLKAGFEKAD